MTSEQVTPDAMRMVQNLFSAIASLKQAVRIRYELSGRLKDEQMRRNQISELLTAARNLILLNKAFQVEILCRSGSEKLEVERILRRSFNRNDKNTGTILEHIKIIQRQRMPSEAVETSIPTVRITDEIVTALADTETPFDGARYADGDEIVYTDSSKPDTSAGLLVLAAAHLGAAALSQKTLDALVKNENRALQVRSASYLQGLPVLIQMIAVRAVEQAA